MSTVYNIRGTNGSGKTTLARAFLPPNLQGDERGRPIHMSWYDSPTKKDPSRQKRVEGYVRADRPLGTVGVVGPYNTPTGGLDAVPSFAIQQAAISWMINHVKADHVICEGVLASTVYGSWAAFDRALEAAGHRFAYVYLGTPVDVCLERIAARQRAAGRERPIKEELVRDKVRAVAATRTRAIADGRRVYDLPFGQEKGEVAALRDIMEGNGEMYRAA